GKFVYKSLDELAYQNKKEIEIYLQEEKFDKILLDKNIYNEDLHEIFKNYLCVYFELGILPDSWLFYKDADELYDRRYWDIDLDKLQIKEMQAYITSLKFEEKKKILTFIQKLGFSKDDDLYKIVFYLKNELYSFAKNDGFYQIIFDKKKMLMLGNYDKEYYSLKSFVYKPYLYEIKRVRFFSKILEFLGLNFLLSLISQTKFYRLAR
ncbi:sugar transferase, partial [Campylobacter coli]|nr:sugar transferase [Campylobacter coli]